MNVFVIPSWYPSLTDPLPGIFFQDQTMAMASQYKESNFGISTWGQNDDRLLLWSKDPVKSFLKLISKPKPTEQLLYENLIEYFTPAYTWSAKLLDGNFEQFLKANQSNFRQFESAYGKVDLIHAHVGYPAGYIAKKLAEIHEIPYVVTEHMSPFPHTQFLDSRNEMSSRLQQAYKSSSRNISVSHNLEQQMISFGIENTTVIPNLVDEAFFNPNSNPIKHEKFTFFSLGRMVPQKGIDLLLHAFAQMENKAILRIGGDGANRSDYQKLAADLGIEESVKWLGELDKIEVLHEYHQCDAFVLPSRHESMGVVFAEAMACGKPVIATICGGPEEFVSDDCGYLVEPENKNELALAMNKMMKNHQFFDAKKISDHCHTRFSQEVVCQQIMDVYVEMSSF